MIDRYPILVFRCVALGLTILWLSGCSQSTSDAQELESCEIALAPHAGQGRLDGQIRQAQEKASQAPHSREHLERLGWLYVSKARQSYDPGFFKLAELSALCIDAKGSGTTPASLLLRGHALHNLHRFQEAEKLARTLTSQRGLAYDFGLLGDVLMEQGRLREAGEAYQRMVDMKPDLRAYSRAAHIRWLKGDLEGAIALLRMSTQAGSARDPESVAWALTRLATHEFQVGATEDAQHALARALSLQADYAPALLLRGRLFLASGQAAQAVEDLTRAADLNPLPEYRWVLSEALRESGRSEDAGAVEAAIQSKGASEDPRTVSVFLATQGKDPQTALKLAREELAARQDVFTFDALAWALRAAGRLEDARSAMQSALAEGTRDARLFLHAAAIASDQGNREEARNWLGQAEAIRHMLLPSEKRLLESLSTEFTD